jgi:voltage-gated potassium channel
MAREKQEPTKRDAMEGSSIKLKIWRVLQGDSSAGKLGWIVNLGLVLLIMSNVLAVIVDTVPSISSQYGGFLGKFEVFSIAIFTIEYLVRLWASTSDIRFRNPVLGRIRYALTPLAVIDFLSIFPFYLPSLGIDLLPLRLFRLIRLVRILKLGRYSESLQLVGHVLRARKGDLASTALVAVVLLLISATLLHTVEGPSQPEQFGSIPDCMWWAAVTMTTVGYGDVYPKTPIGKFLGGLVAFIGIGMFALPAGILGAGYLEARAKKSETGANPEGRCPYCGRSLDATER